MSQRDLAVAITTMNSMRTIRCVIESVAGIASRIVVIDSGSTDGTIDLCHELGAETIQREWPGFAQQKQFAIDQCAEHAWVLLLDSDESLEQDLRESVCRVLAEDDPAFDGWEINRKVWFLGGWLHYTYQPDRVLRLVRGGHGRMRTADDRDVSDLDQVHERLAVAGRVGRLTGTCRHDTWADVTDGAARHAAYARKAAEGARRGGTPLHLLVNPPAAMVKQLIIKRGALDGLRGLIAAGLAFNGTMLKHACIAERRLSDREVSR